MDSDKNRQGKVYGERNTLAVGQDVGIWLHRPDDAEQEAEHNKATAGVVQAGGDGEAPMKTTHVAGALAGGRASRPCFPEGRK